MRESLNEECTCIPNIYKHIARLHKHLKATGYFYCMIIWQSSHCKWMLKSQTRSFRIGLSLISINVIIISLTGAPFTTYSGVTSKHSPGWMKMFSMVKTCIDAVFRPALREGFGKHFWQPFKFCFFPLRCRCQLINTWINWCKIHFMKLIGPWQQDRINWLIKNWHKKCTIYI
jgi:hypothetical protein